MKFEYALGVVAPTQLVPVLQEIQQATGCAYASCYRGEDAQALLNAHGLHTQAQIYWEYTHGEEPNPANPPGRSTHECRSDGVPYPGPIGRHLFWWQCGIDVDVAHVPAFIGAAARRGWVAFRPYPSGSEYHHVNFSKMPKVANPFLPLSEGHSKGKGVFVYILRSRLRALGWRMDGGKGKIITKGGSFNHATTEVVKRFQKEHHLSVDGVVGPLTWMTIKRLAQSKKRRERRNRKRN